MAQVITFEDFRPSPRYDATPWTNVRIEESSDYDSAAPDDATWATIDTVALSPVDADPADPAARDITTESADDAAGLWYRLTFVDGSGDEALPASPLQNLVDPLTAAVATADELAARLGLEFTLEERDRAEILLALASSVIRDEVSQTIGLAEDGVLTRRGTTDARIPLPGWPVVSVASVTLNGTTMGGWFVSGNELVRDGFTVALIDGVANSDWVISSGFGFERDTLVITYTHGYANPPALVKQIALEMCVRVWVNPGSAISEADGSTAATYAPYADPPRGLMLTKAELGALRRKFGARGRSLTIGGG